MKRRIGIFEMQYHLLDSVDALQIIGDVLSTMQFVPTRVEAIYHLDAFEYTGYSPLFDELAVGEVVPRYDLMVTASVGLKQETVIEKVEVVRK